MYSRRKFLVGLIVFVPTLFAPVGLLWNIRNNQNYRKNGKFLKRGWVLQEGDV